jgi:hypothetical protein
MIQRTLHTTVGATALSAALAMGWTTVAAIIVLTIALCWVVADADRPHRLALLLTTWRHGTPAPPSLTQTVPPTADRTTEAPPQRKHRTSMRGLSPSPARRTT